MTVLTSPQLFAERGEAWNTPNFQHAASRKFRKRQPDGTYAPLEREDIDGYEPVSLSPTRAEPKPKWVDPPRPQPDPTGRLRCNRIMQAKKALRKAVYNASR